MSTFPSSPTPTMPPPPAPIPPERHGRPSWFLPALVAVLVGGAVFVIWRSMSGGGTREMREGSVVAGTRGDAAAPVVVDSAAAPAPVTLPATSPATTISSTVAPSGGVEFASRCRSAPGASYPGSAGWAVGVPLNWYAGDAASGWECALFDRAPVVVDDWVDTIWPIWIQATPYEVDDVSTADNPYIEVLTQEPTTVDGYTAVRMEYMTKGGMEIRAGVQAIDYTVDLGPALMLTITGYAFTDAEHSELISIIDAMAADITIEVP